MFGMKKKKTRKKKKTNHQVQTNVAIKERKNQIITSLSFSLSLSPHSTKNTDVALRKMVSFSLCILVPNFRKDKI
jgi:hypothetical protein